MEIDDGLIGGESWLVTFSDLAMLLLTFFVMKYSMSSPRNENISMEEAPVLSTSPEISSGGETFVIDGAFNPSNGSDLSFRGMTALAALGEQAKSFDRTIVVSLTGYKNSEEEARLYDLLLSQREGVLRQFIDSGVEFTRLAISPNQVRNIGPGEGKKANNPVFSRLEITLQEKRI